MRFVNPQKESYHHEVIREFSDNTRFMMSGATKGFVRSRYSWFADFANKFSGNETFNTHVAYISFFSDYEIFISEYANVEHLTDEYPLLLSVSDKQLSGHDHELTTKQYFKISNQYSSFDIIEFINESKLTILPYSDPDVVNISHYHSFYYAPVIYETGYRIDKGELNLPLTQTNYDMYLWAARYSSQLSLQDYSFVITLCGSGTDSYYGSTYLLSGMINRKRLVDYKVIASDSNWFFIDSDENEKIAYPYPLKDEESWSYRPYTGLPIIYDKVTDTQLREQQPTQWYLFPQICYKDVIERQKFAAYKATYGGRVHFHASGLSGELDDQSQIVFNVSKNERYDHGGGNYWVGQSLPDSTKIDGIDIEIERNRRNSAMVTTEPYMAVRPLANGQIVEYKFIQTNGNDISGPVPSYAPRTIKLKAPRPFIRTLDRELNKREYNTDILHTLHVQWPDGLSCEHSNDYDSLTKTLDPLWIFKRREYALDDLVGGIVGVGKRYVFTTTFSGMTSEYSDSKAKVCGMGFFSTSTQMYLRLYCTNYVPDFPIANEEVAITVDAGHIERVERYELFRPMLRVSGIRGFLKIINRSSAFKPVVLNDGTEEVVYDVEWPYCAGSSSEIINLTESVYHKAQIFYKVSYINAGSQAEDSNGKVNLYNARYAPSGDDVFCRADLAQAYDYSSETIESDPEIRGGAIPFNGEELVSRPNNRLIYPSYLVFQKKNYRFLGLTKPRTSVTGLETYGKLGTFELHLHVEVAGIDIDTGLPPANSDLKLIWCVDNRTWKFGEDKFSSYINRETPSYVFEIDSSELSEEFGKKQHQYAGIPDIKRWIYAKALAFCATTIVPATANDEDYTDGRRDVPTQDSKSDVMIEIWDNAYEIGSTTRAMWRPITTSLYDDDKSSSKTLVTGLHTSGTKTLIYGNLYSVVLEKFDSDTFDEGLTEEEISSINGLSNLALIDSENEKAYHIAYVEDDSSDPDNIKAIAYVVMGAADTLPPANYILDPYNWVGPVSVTLPYSKLNKNTDFAFNSCKAVDGVIQNRYLDFGDRNTYNSDFNRYIDSNGKIYVRIRPLKRKTFPVAHSQVLGDPDTMQWIESRVTSAFAETNFPWYNQIASDWDEQFDWSKIDLIEHVRKFGLNYFSLQSK